MKDRRPLIWMLVSLACFIAAFYFWKLGDKWARKPAATNAPAGPASSTPTNPTHRLTSSYEKRDSTAPVIAPLHPMTNGVARRSTNFPYRLSNTTQSIGQLIHNSKAILLENAFIDLSKPLNLDIPDSLRAHGDPGAYIVQADGPIDNAFRAELKSAGLSIVSYFPNNAYLVLGTAAQVAPFGASAIPWQPYYKVKSALMPAALAGQGFSAVNVAVFPGAIESTEAALNNLGVTVVSQSPSPFGTELALQNVSDVTALANVNGVMEVEPASQRMVENDLTRVLVSETPDVFVPTNYLGLTGTNVLIEVNDSWVPTNSGTFSPLTTINPDLVNIVQNAIFPNGIADFSGHATHVGGIIACSGDNSPSNAVGSLPGANFRGKAPSANLFPMPIMSGISDAQLQEAAAQTNALISNNSWGYGSTSYDLAAASYDQAVRDSVPGQTGSQSLIYVFSAGNSGSGDGNGDGLGGQPDTLSSPGVAKNVISIGASMLPRDITNQAYVCDICDTNNGCTTNQPWLADTSSSNLVADFSSRGNVGIGIEGQYGRFKPDLIAPGTFVVSTRSLTWDTNAYYDPTNFQTVEYDGDTVDSNGLFNYSIFVPCDTAQINVTVTSVNPTNVPLVVYINPNTFPTTTTYLAVGTNQVSVPQFPPLTPTDTQWFISVGDTTNQPVTYDIVIQLVTTNDLGDYWDVLRTNLNDQLISSNGQVLYRYESGTSMAAGAASGVLALMEDFFTNRLNYTPSPALMKALLINGARSINEQYDFQVQNNINYQGWGMINLTNSLPAALTTNGFTTSGAPIAFVDQNTNNTLATGDTQTYTLIVTNATAQQTPLRVTLAWTDPPGNPLASLKLVNNLELVVTNTDNPTNPPVFFGNDFESGSVFTAQWDGDTNNIPYDTVNNVQNIYLEPPLGTNYTITVFAKDVNVNAVTANTNAIVQDYALVVSSDNGEISNAFTLGNAPILANSYEADLTTVTNEFPNSPSVSGGLLLNQLVGASSPLQGTNTLSLSSVNQDNWATNGQITLGVSNQWHFYVITNVVGSNADVPVFTNAAFATFEPSDLSIPPTGVDAPSESDATRPEADIDLYVARGPTAYLLTNLDPATVAGADKSLGRGGTEMIVYSNAQQNEVFYIGVKSEDQEAAVYDFAGLFSEFPFSTTSNGVEVVNGINVPNPINSASSTLVSSTITLGIAVQPIEIRRAVVTNHIECQNFGNLFGVLTHNSVSDVLNNHSFGNNSTNAFLIYEDNGQGDIAGSQKSDGPGSLRNFIGQQGIGLWTMTEFNDAEFNTGQVDSVSIRLEPQQNGNNSITATIQPGTFFYDFIDVPPDATNLTICVGYDPSDATPQPVDLFVKFGALPTFTSFDYTQVINPPGSCLSIGQTSLPPLKPGRYFVGVFNPPNNVAQTIRLSWTFGLNVNGVNPVPIVSTNAPISILEDAVTNSSIFITNQQNIVSVNVGVVLTDPQVSDLDLTLVSPTGQRILLFENRGGTTATNMGHLNIVTNYFGQTTPGGANANTNIIGPVPSQGTLYIDYNMFTVPDRMDVYYEGVDIFSTTSINPPSGLISGAGTFQIPYPGPGFPYPATNNTISIVMNQGNNPVSTTEWVYTPYVATENFIYLTFTDDTNLTDMPIKYAIPPYDAADVGTNLFFGDFDLASNRDYIATPASFTNFIPDIAGGWSLTTNNVFVLPTNYYTGTNLISMATNMVTVFTDPLTAANGSNVLALGNGSISRVLQLTPARNYTVSYLYRGPGIAGWWRGEGNSDDSADPETLGNNGDLIGRFNFPAGEVGQAFAMEDSGTAFEFAGTNTYVQIPQSPSLDVGSTNYSGFTVEGWINPTNIDFQQPLVEWLAHVPTNTIVNGQPVTNLVIEAGPFLNRANGHYYYLLGPTNWTTSELWANSLGGHLVEVDDANEEQFVYDTFARFGLTTNHTMWIGLTNSGTTQTNFVWSTGNSNLVYTNWAPGEPTNCGGPGYVAILGPTNALPGLWTVLNNNGVDCNGVTNAPFGVVEVDEIQTNGVQLWISVTNSATNNVLTGNGRLYANIMDTNNVPHEIYSAPGLIQSNVFQHVALTYNTNTGVAELFYDGTNVATTNLGVFVPNTGGDVLLGKDMSRVTNNFYWGLMDEMSIYSRFLSDAEIYSIWNISASTTNRNLGKFNPAIAPAESLAEAQAVFGGVTNLLFGVNQTWQSAGFTFKSASNTLPVQITGLEPGILVDSLSLFEQPPDNLYYLPEQALDALVGSNAYGNWTLEIRDSRTGDVVTNAQLVSWELQFILQTNTPIPIVLSPQTPSTNVIPPGDIGYYIINVPDWANDATNILSSTAPVSMLFDQTTPPETGGADFLFVNNSTAGSATIQANPPTTPRLLPGQSYYLAVTNPGPTSATVVVQVDFNIMTLTNGVPFTSTFTANDTERPYVFYVDTTNASEATFQLMQMTGDADLVLRQGLPLPSLMSADYGSFSGSNANRTIYVLTNSAPVPLSPGPWYLDVVKRSFGAMRYAVLAKELTNTPTIINITNGVPFTWTAGPGAALTNFFRFGSSNFANVVATNLGVHFELYNQTGNGDLTVQTNNPPLAPPFFQSSQLPTRDPEFIFIHTNASSLTNVALDWYLGVPNNETNPITFTIVGTVDTNLFPSFPTAEGAGSETRGGAFATNVYHVTTLADSGAGSLRAAVTATNGGGTVVFDTSGTINLASPLYLTNSFYTIAGQTAPGGNGVTIAGAPVYLQDVTDIILRYLRFRPAGTNIMDSLQFTNADNIVADHVSVAFGTSNVVSILNSSNVTVQWSVLADSLNGIPLPPTAPVPPGADNPVTGGTSIRFGSGDVTLHHNLYADNYSGNPTIGEDVTLDFVNNVIYNWGIFAGDSTNDIVDNPGGITNFLNFSANYLIAGTNSVFTNGAFVGSSADTFIFQTNNFIDTNLNSILDGSDTSWNMFTGQYTEFSAPWPILPTAPDQAFIAYERVLDFAGTSMDKRDPMDIGTVEQVRLFGGTNAGGPALLSGMEAWWKAEGNTVDSINANNGTIIGGVTYAPGEVGEAFVFDGTSGLISVPASPSLNVGTNGTGLTLEAWVDPAQTTFQELLEWNEDTGGTSGAAQIGVHMEINESAGDGSFVGNVVDTTATSHNIYSPTGIIVTNTFQHLAMTYDKASGQAFLYRNGAVVASTNMGTFTPQTSFGFFMGDRPSGFFTGNFFGGKMDEVSVYNRALAPCEIAAIYNAGSAGKASLLSGSGSGGTSSAVPPYLNTSGDGIPDFWKITLGEPLTNFDANIFGADGYTYLEEYLNWLGGPHALTLTNTTTNVDLYVISGKTGNLTFGVQNGTNGTVYLTNNLACEDPASGGETIAVFTPTNSFNGSPTNGGFASFSYTVTNTDTVAYFGPVTVSVFVSSVPITNLAIFSFPNPTNIEMNPNTTVLVTNTAIPTNGVTYQLLNPPTPGWVTINPNTGVITLSPTNGPSTNTVATVATDTNVPPDMLTNTFTVIVNGPPVFILNPPPNLTNGVGVPINVTNAATDPDMPPSDLFYQLIMPPSPTNAVIGTNTGIITWTPLPSQLGTNEFETVVTDTNGLSATNFFFIYVITASAPYAFTQPAQGVTGTTAQLNGMATPNGALSSAWFEWGTNTLYGNTTPATGVGSGLNVVYVNSQITGIVPNVVYHYRLVAASTLGTNYGFDQILDEANVVVWGADYLQQSQAPAGLTSISAVAAAYDHSLALRNTESVVAWGDNTFGQLKVPASLNNALAVAGGQYSSMALRVGGNVAAWGGNVFQVTNVPSSATNVIMISGGTDASLALQSNGNVVAWGSASVSGVTNLVNGLTNNEIVEIANGNFHGLAIKNDGTVIAWGDDSAGQTDVPAGLSNVVQISGGNFHSLALKSDGTVVAWGDGSSGQTNVPPGLTNVVAVAAGGFHSMALKSDGTMVGWGDDSAGQISFPPGLTNAVAIAAGNLHSLALTPLSLASITGPIILPTTNGAPETNTILPNQTLFYQVNVPGNADFSTNVFGTLGGNLNMFFTTNTPPTITNLNDVLLVTNALSGSATLSTNGSPHFTDGATYYLGLQNTNTFAVSVGVEVTFHFITTVPSTNTSPISIVYTNIGGTNGFLLTWYAPSNDLFNVQWTPGLLPTTWKTFTNPPEISFDTAYTNINATNTLFEFFDDGTQTGGFGPTRFYRVILLNGAVTAPPTPLSNGTGTTNGINPGQTNFYQITVPTNAFFATNSLFSVSGGPLNIWFSTNAPPSVGSPNDSLLISNAASGSRVLSTNGSPQLVDGGTYYLGVQNTNSFSVVYGIEVNFGFVAATNGPSTNSVPISSITHATNGFLLVWFAPSNDLFRVQWTPSLSPTTWTTFPNPPAISFDTTYTNINATNTEFDFLDDGSQTGGFGPTRFYQLILLNGSASTPSAIPLTNGVPLVYTTVAGSTNFFSFNITQSNAAVLFELYNLTGGGLMNLQRSNLPITPPYFTNSAAGPSTNYQQIVLRTNAAGLANLNAVSWFLGVPNGNATPITYTIRAVLPTNGILVSGLPIGTTVSQSGGTNLELSWAPTVTGEAYEVLTNADLALSNNWGLLSSNVASGTSLNFTNAVPVGGLPALFYWVVQVP